MAKMKHCARTGKDVEFENRRIKKIMPEQFRRDVLDMTDRETHFLSMMKRDLGPETETLICAAQVQALRQITSDTEYIPL